MQTVIERFYTPLKMVHHPERLAELRGDGYTHSPVSVQFDLTGRCNYDCPWCYFIHGVRYEDGDGARNPAYDLSTEWVLRTFEELTTLGVKGIEITGGGEPLLHREAPILMEAAVARFDVGVITNGSLLWRIPDEVLRRTAWVRVSLNSGTEEGFRQAHHIVSAKTNREYRQRVLDGLGRAAALDGPDVSVQYCIAQENWSPHELRACVEICRDLGVRNVRFSASITKKGEDFLTLAQRHAVTTMLADLEDEHRAHPTFSVINLFTERVHHYMHDPQYHRRCLFQHLVGVIGSDYGLYACCATKYMARFLIVDLRECASFQEAWTARRRAFVDALSPVRDCPPCWMHKKNDLLEYLMTDDRQVNFP